MQDPAAFLFMVSFFLVYMTWEEAYEKEPEFIKQVYREIRYEHLYSSVDRAEAPWIISIKKPRTGVQHLFILIGIYKNGQKPAQKQYNGFISS